MEFNAPGKADYFEIKKYVGALALIAVNEYLPAFTTTMGVSKAVKAKVAILDGPYAGDVYPDAMFFGKKIVPQMSGQIGSVMLGRIGQGQARPGQSAPYQLDDFTPEDAKLANDWVDKNGPFESSPTDSSMGGGSYAPDNENWASQRQATAPQPPAVAGPPAVGRAPQPPAYPSSYAPAGAPTQDDEPPF